MLLVPTLIALLAQTPTSIEADQAMAEQFRALEAQVSAALLVKNVAALDQLLAKDFAFSLFLEGRAPRVMNRGEWMKMTEYYTLSGFEIQHVSARVFGSVAAVGLQPNRKATAGATLDRSGEFAVVDIWTKVGDGWKLSSRYLSRPDAVKR
jgi:hypothetical protein